MRQACAVLALGLGLVAASLARAGDILEAAPAPLPLPSPVSMPVGHAGAPCGVAADCGCGARGGTCWQRLVGWFTYHALPVSPCCKQCPFCCRRACYCPLPPYAYFLGNACCEGRRYLTTPCCGGGSCATSNLGPPPLVDAPASIARIGPRTQGPVVPGVQSPPVPSSPPQP